MDKEGYDKSPNHPVRSKEAAPDNVVSMPNMRMRKMRVGYHKFMDKHIGVEQVIQPPENLEPKEPETRSEHFGVGQQEGTLHSLHEQRIKRNMRAGDESVGRMINMDDPTKD